MSVTKETNRERALRAWTTMRTPEWLAAHNTRGKYVKKNKEEIIPRKMTIWEEEAFAKGWII